MDKSFYIQAAKLHIKNLESGFLPTLGVGFLTLMYECIDQSPSTTLIVRNDGNRMIGFVSGSKGETSIYRLMSKKPFKFMKSLFPVVFSPKKIFSVLEILMHLGSNDRKKFPKAELLTIVVEKELRTKGVAASLYNDLIDYFAVDGIPEFTVVVGKTLEANFFYKKMGARVVGELSVHKNSPSYVYVHSIMK